MVVISSQRYLNPEIVETKINELIESETSVVIIPVVDAFYQDLNGDDLFIMTDKHHTLQAAKILGIKIEFEIVEDELTSDRDIAEKNGEGVLPEHKNDNNWYYVSVDQDIDFGGDVW